MILSGLEIKKHLGNDIMIEPFDENSLNPNSYNLRLADELLVYDEEILDMRNKNKFHKIKIPHDGLIIYPGKLYLGQTIEFTQTNNFIPMLEGRSSIGRLGMFVHVTAGFGDVGFKGFWTLEIHCIQPIKIYAGIEICQIYYHTIQGNYENYCSGKYQNNSGVQPSFLYKDFN